MIDNGSTKQLINTITHGQPKKVIREQHCSNCARHGQDMVLAFEVTDHNVLGFAIHSEYWWLKTTLHTGKGLKCQWKKERWYGNYVICPICGVQGRLPMDKPLSQDNIEIAHTSPEVQDLNNRITKRLTHKYKMANDAAYRREHVTDKS